MKNFKDLEEFVDYCLKCLPEEVVHFQRQVKGVNNMFEAVRSTEIRLETLNWNFLKLKALNEEISHGLDQIKACQDLWESVLVNLEGKCECSAFMDGGRASIYSLTERIFATLLNMNEVLGEVSEKVANYNTERRQEPTYLILEIVKSNLEILERLYFHIQYLQEQSNSYSAILQKLQNPCKCNFILN